MTTPHGGARGVGVAGMTSPTEAPAAPPDPAAAPAPRARRAPADLPFAFPDAALAAVLGAERDEPALAARGSAGGGRGVRAAAGRDERALHVVR